MFKQLVFLTIFSFFTFLFINENVQAKRPGCSPGEVGAAVDDDDFETAAESCKGEECGNLCKAQIDFEVLYPTACIKYSQFLDEKIFSVSNLQAGIKRNLGVLNTECEIHKANPGDPNKKCQEATMTEFENLIKSYDKTLFELRQDQMWRLNKGCSTKFNNSSDKIQKDAATSCLIKANKILDTVTPETKQLPGVGSPVVEANAAYDIACAMNTNKDDNLSHCKNQGVKFREKSRTWTDSKDIPARLTLLESSRNGFQKSCTMGKQDSCTERDSVVGEIAFLKTLLPK